MVGGDEGGGPSEVEVRAACEDLVVAVQERSAQRADVAMTRLAGALSAGDEPSIRDLSVLVLAECVRARLQLEAGHRGAARLSAVTTLALARALEGEEASRSLGRVLISTAGLACDLGDVQVAWMRAREALAIAQAAFGTVDPDTASAWQVLGVACQAAGNPVGANAARRQAVAAGLPADNGDRMERLSERRWLLSP